MSLSNATFDLLSRTTVLTRKPRVAVYSPSAQYPVADMPTADEIGGCFSERYRGRLAGTIRALPTGEFRPPRTGEWFLSGAIIEAYRASSDMTSSYHIATLTWTSL